MYEKHTTSTYTRTPIVHVRKTSPTYMQNDPNSACTQNTFFVHTLARQFCMYAKHIWPTYIIVSILHVRKTGLAYTRATTNWLTRRRARPTPLAGPQTLLSHFIEQVQPEHGTKAARRLASSCSCSHPTATCSQSLGVTKPPTNTTSVNLFIS